MARRCTTPQVRIFYTGKPDISGLVHKPSAIARLTVNLLCRTKMKDVLWTDISALVTCPRCKAILWEKSCRK